RPGSADLLKVVEIETSAVPDDGVLVRVHAASINPVDLFSLTPVRHFSCLSALDTSPKRGRCWLYGSEAVPRPASTYGAIAVRVGAAGPPDGRRAALSGLRWKQVLRPRRGIRKCEGRLLDLSVSPRQAAAVMLAQMLLPGGDAEGLDKAIRSFCVPVQLPARRPGSESRLAKLIHRLQEGRLPLGRDGELDLDQDGPCIGLRV